MALSVLMADGIKRKYSSLSLSMKIRRALSSLSSTAAHLQQFRPPSLERFECYFPLDLIRPGEGQGFDLVQFFQGAFDIALGLKDSGFGAGMQAGHDCGFRQL